MSQDVYTEDTSTAEYAFLYKLYNGKSYRFIEKDDPAFLESWLAISLVEAIQTRGNKDRHMIEQIFKLGPNYFSCLWTDVKAMSIEEIIKPPSVISWVHIMAEPTDTQKPLF